jgi:hypothetical protein
LLYYRQIYRQRQTAFSLVEIAVATTITLFVVYATLTFFTYGARMSQFAAIHIVANVQGGAPIEMLKNRVRMGVTCSVTNGGDRLDITNPDASVTSFYYWDPDSTPGTIANNSLMYKLTANDAAKKLLGNIDRSSGLPMFSPVLSTVDPVTIQLRLGAYAPLARTKTYGLDILTTVGVRNRG